MAQAAAQISTRGPAPLIWGHAGTDAQMQALVDITTLVARLQPDVTLLLTCDAAQDSQVPQADGFLIKRAELPSDSQRAARWFINLHKPDICLWAANTLRPTLLQQVQDRGATMIMLDPDPTRLPVRRRVWFSDPVGDTLALFDDILVRSDAAGEQIKRLGAVTRAVRVASPLRSIPFPPTCDDADMNEASASLAGRPAWFATQLPLGTALKDVVKAQAATVRLSHRLLLVIDPLSVSDIATYQAVLDEAGLRHATWHVGDPIEEFTQVLVLDDPVDATLWFRLAALTLMPAAGASPMIPAALGSGVLFGPDPSRFAKEYAALVEAGAARRIRNAETLSQAVLELSAPDRTAAMALAGWEVVTDGAELANQTARLVGQALDSLGPPDAPT